MMRSIEHQQQSSTGELVLRDESQLGGWQGQLDQSAVRGKRSGPCSVHLQNDIDPTRHTHAHNCGDRDSQLGSSTGNLLGGLCQAFLGGRPGPRLAGALFDARGLGPWCVDFWGMGPPFIRAPAWPVPVSGSAAEAAGAEAAAGPCARPLSNCATEFIPARTELDCL